MGLNQSIESQNEIVEQTTEKHIKKDNFECKIII